MNGLAPIPLFVQRFTEGSLSFMVGVAADRPTASMANVGWVYFATDTDGGTSYICVFSAGAGYSWVKLASPVTPPTTSAPSWVSVPSSSTASGSPGQMAYDPSAGQYLYVCYAINTWARYQKDLAVW